MVYFQNVVRCSTIFILLVISNSSDVKRVFEILKKNYIKIIIFNRLIKHLKYLLPQV